MAPISRRHARPITGQVLAGKSFPGRVILRRKGPAAKVLGDLADPRLAQRVQSEQEGGVFAVAAGVGACYLSSWAVGQVRGAEWPGAKWIASSPSFIAVALTGIAGFLILGGRNRNRLFAMLGPAIGYAVLVGATDMAPIAGIPLACGSLLPLMVGSLIAATWFASFRARRERPRGRILIVVVAALAMGAGIVWAQHNDTMLTPKSSTDAPHIVDGSCCDRNCWRPSAGRSPTCCRATGITSGRRCWIGLYS
jgi:hypothetical protein